MFFNKKVDLIPEGWIIIDSMDLLQKADEVSFEKPVVLFKHSTRCPVSTFAFNRLREGWKELGDKVQLYYLDLIAYRAISNQIASAYRVTHQSPQILLILNGKCIMDCSHESVSVQEIEAALASQDQVM